MLGQKHTPEYFVMGMYLSKMTECISHVIVQELCESRGGHPGAVRPNEPSGFRGRKELLNHASALVTTCP